MGRATLKAQGAREPGPGKANPDSASERVQCRLAYRGKLRCYRPTRIVGLGTGLSSRLHTLFECYPLTTK